MGILSKYVGAGEPFQVGEDTIYLKPLTTKHIPQLFKVMKMFSGIKGDNPDVSEMFRNMDDEGMKNLSFLIDETLALSLPQEPEEDRKSFGAKYCMELLPKIMEINMSMGEKSHENLKKLESIKLAQQRRDEAKTAA